MEYKKEENTTFEDNRGITSYKQGGFGMYQVCGERESRRWKTDFSKERDAVSPETLSLGAESNEGGCRHFRWRSMYKYKDKQPGIQLRGRI